MRWMRYWMAVLAAALLLACGGGGGSGGVPAGGGGDGGGGGGDGEQPAPLPAVAAVEVLGSAASLSSASANTLTITALVKNASNNGMADVPVSFAADSGVLQGVSATTDASGTAVATLATGANRANREIRVTVTAGVISNSLVVPVTGTSLSLVGVGSALVGGPAATYTLTLLDSGGNPMAGETVSVTSSLGNNVSPATVQTDASGMASFNYTPNNAGADVLSVAGAGTSARMDVHISGEDFTVVSPAAGTEVLVGATREVRVRYRSGGLGVAGQTVQFSSTRGTVSPASAVTDANGEAAVTVTSPTAGPATVTAQMAGGALTSLGLLFTASVPDNIVLQINPAAVPTNPAGSAANRAQLQAVVRDAAGNPVKGRTVNFTLVQDTSGGRVNTGTGVTDANGTVVDFFIPGSASTATNGVRIRAAVAGTAVQSEASLTVSAQALFIAIATSNTIANKGETIYSKPFSVRVTDANGTAVKNQSIALSVFPTEYGKGTLAYNGTVWAPLPGQPLWCPNEDLNKDGVLQPGEDTNTDGALTPGMPGAIGVAVVTTDDSGYASFDLDFGEQYAPWVRFEITARASVAGTESASRMLYTASGLDSDFTNEAVAPAGAVSPFGYSLDCTVPN